MFKNNKMFSNDYATGIATGIVTGIITTSLIYIYPKFVKKTKHFINIIKILTNLDEILDKKDNMNDNLNDKINTIEKSTNDKINTLEKSTNVKFNILNDRIYNTYNNGCLTSLSYGSYNENCHELEHKNTEFIAEELKKQQKETPWNYSSRVNKEIEELIKNVENMKKFDLKINNGKIILEDIVEVKEYCTDDITDNITNENENDNHNHNDDLEQNY